MLLHLPCQHLHMWGLLGLWAFKHPSLYRGVRVQRPAGGRCRWSCSRCWLSATSTPFTGGRTAAAAACCGIPGGTEGCLPLPGHGCDVQPPALFPAHPAPSFPASLPTLQCTCLTTGVTLRKRSSCTAWAWAMSSTSGALATLPAASALCGAGACVSFRATHPPSHPRCPAGTPAAPLPCPPPLQRAQARQGRDERQVVQHQQRGAPDLPGPRPPTPHPAGGGALRV